MAPREVDDRLVARPQLLQREVPLEPLDHSLPVDAECQVFLVPISEAGPEDEAPAGQHVDGGELLGRGDRIVKRQQVDGNHQIMSPVRSMRRPSMATWSMPWSQAPVRKCWVTATPSHPKSTRRVGDAQFAGDLGGQVAPESVLIGDHCAEPQRVYGTLGAAHQ